jgi:hypothetical protein
MRTLVALLICLPALAAQWVSGGRRFGAPETLHASNPERIVEASLEIANHLSLLHARHFSGAREQVAVVFEGTGDVDAVFFPAGLYSGELAAAFRNNDVIQLHPRLIGNARLWRLLGHEFFHAIHHHYSPQEVDWIREGLAQKFEHDVYNSVTQGHLRAALTSSRHALEESFDVANPAGERYGNTFLFFHHLEQTCGVSRPWETAFVAATSGLTGRSVIDALLRSTRTTFPACQSARELMSDFVISKLTNQRSASHPRALWPLMAPMAPMDAEARQLAAAPAADVRRFLELLPPFLGLKLPLASWRPNLRPSDLQRLGIVLKVWEPTLPLPRLVEWTAGGTFRPGSQLILFKAR